MYLVTQLPKTRFRHSHNFLVKLVDAPTKVAALKQSGYVTRGKHSEYQAPEAHWIEFDKELPL